MTAEIAVLNKSAVALAADSAVTIAAGRTQHKVYDSADKLFELSEENPIGIMIYNGMSFSQTPLAQLICDFRGAHQSFARVEDAATSFLEMLDGYGKSSPEFVKSDNLDNIVNPIINQLFTRVQRKVSDFIESGDFDPSAYQAKRAEIYDNVIASFERIYSRRDDARFIGGSPKLVVDQDARKKIRQTLENKESPDLMNKDRRDRIVKVVSLALQKDLLSTGKTGIVIAGFGHAEQFPTLVSYEIDGIVCGRLKYVQTNAVDIDQSGPRASIIPFAQKEMVERFLLGMDDSVQDQLTSFCRKTVSNISNELLSLVDFYDEADETNMRTSAKNAEDAFVNGLKREAFEKIREQSRQEVEDMVEFMPKPELAKMAEALVNVTSIKRRVTRGMETVGGPIDVALISRTEGLIWVKRKHYFEAGLNPRHVARLNSCLRRQATLNKEAADG